MSPTQKRIFEWPILLLVLWMLQALEISLLQLPFSLGSVHVFVIVISYLALTRDWLKMMLLSVGFSIMASFTTTVPAGVHIATLLWMGLLSKIFVQEFALEGRRTFMLLAVSNFAFYKLSTWIILKLWFQTFSLADTVSSILLSAPVVMVGAHLAFPWLLKWDHYFDHPVHESRDLMQGTLR
jgi:hypothetical protein